MGDDRDEVSSLGKTGLKMWLWLRKILNDLGRPETPEERERTIKFWKEYSEASGMRERRKARWRYLLGDDEL